MINSDGHHALIYLFTTYHYDWSVVVQYFGVLMSGVVYTVEIALTSLVFAMILGLFIALLRMAPWAPLRMVGFTYVQLFRALSLYVYMLLLYFGLPAVTGISFGARTAAIISLTLLHGAYISEVYRAAIGSIDPEQHEAAASLGMSPATAFVNITFPQAGRIAVPTLVNSFVDLIKDSSIVATIGAGDLMYKTIQTVSSTHRSFELYTTTGLIYLTLVLIVSQAAVQLERRLRIHLA